MPRKPQSAETVTVPPGYRAQLVRAGRGRPKLSPDGARKRGYLLTDAEHAAVQQFVARLRAANSQ